MTVWDGTEKNAHVVRSGGNLTVTDDTTTFVNFAGRADTGVTAGQKKYWEITVGTGAAGGMGVGLASSSKTWANDSYLGLETQSVGYFGTGDVFYNNALQTTLATYTSGDKVCVAVDEANDKIWWRVNGGNWNNSGSDNPATNTGGFTLLGGLTGTVYPGYNLRNEGVSSTQTANFGMTANAFTAPVGFGSFDDVPMAQSVM